MHLLGRDKLRSGMASWSSSSCNAARAGTSLTKEPAVAFGPLMACGGATLGAQQPHGPAVWRDRVSTAPK